MAMVHEYNGTSPAGAELKLAQDEAQRSPG